MEEIGKNAEITRFKGLGEISPDEFVHFIGDEMRLEPVLLSQNASIDSILSYFMGKILPKTRVYHRKFKSRKKMNLRIRKMLEPQKEIA